jgi:hypothetical protein
VQQNQIDNPSVDITWVFLQSLFMAVNTILWSISYPEVRQLHAKVEVEEIVEIAISLINKCRDRWPGSAAAAQLYSKLAKACLKSYTVSDSIHSSSSLSVPQALWLTLKNLLIFLPLLATYSIRHQIHLQPTNITISRHHNLHSALDPSS